MKKRYIFFLLTAVSLVCMAEDRTHKVDWFGAPQEEEAKRAGDIFDWQLKGPVEFLMFLQEQYTKWPKVLSFYTVWGEHRDWIKAEDIPILFEMTSDPTPCLSVMSVYSSVLISDPSTVGHEALYLIAAYRAGVYPHRIVSTQWEGDVEELKEWWRKEQNLTNKDRLRAAAILSCC